MPVVAIGWEVWRSCWPMKLKQNTQHSDGSVSTYSQVKQVISGRFLWWSCRHVSQNMCPHCSFTGLIRYPTTSRQLPHDITPDVGLFLLDNVEAVAILSSKVIKHQTDNWAVWTLLGY